ncbi:unnamed protein product [Microthlaspi erraticum]|uniref:Reverse transcriptase zinc-binding domain-containing protein n=1 Tax=Microthlaspi erraticum TaxID=1685480 RepID=A0A6D2L0G7_9BRAS|nr:unnamed protein product [Microthlaspi erraticum]
MRVDPQCVRCGMGDETINHMLFECPPARQAWALSPIPTPPLFFPTDALFSNMAHLFWNLPDNDDMLIPKDVMEAALTEARAWAAAQTIPERTQFDISTRPVSVPSGEWCQINGA